jgi:hypothetical protein
MLQRVAADDVFDGENLTVTLFQNLGEDVEATTTAKSEPRVYFAGNRSTSRRTRMAYTCTPA